MLILPIFLHLIFQVKLQNLQNEMSILMIVSKLERKLINVVLSGVSAVEL